MPIDTHQTYRRLVAAGFPEEQAKVQAERRKGERRKKEKRGHRK